MLSIQTTQLNIPTGMIDLGIGQPSPSLLPLDILRQAASHRLSQPDPSLLAYGAEPGDGFFRLALAEFLTRHYGVSVSADQLFITAGASQGLDLICTLYTQPGDTVFVEEPSYFLALRIFADHRLKVVGLPMDGDGLSLEALEEKLAEHRPAFLYTVPVFHNPAGVTLSAARRSRLIELSEQHDFLIVADEVYQLLAFNSAPPPPLMSFDRLGTVLSLGSFSKILAPGLRLGWLQGRPALLDRFINSGLLDSGGGLNPFTSAIVRSVIETGQQEKHLDRLNQVYHQRAAALSSAVRRLLPADVTVVEPHGGFFMWLQFPETIDVETLLPDLHQHNLNVQPGVKFSSRSELRNYARLCFAYYDVEDLEEGVARLAKALTL
ncbi:MAG: PLP-dependent aminotransferase family protein [Anaerolineae bacterium]|nr:PLP-dependent aminotransferase family protein [Anaerolineae bacterium]